MSPSRDRYPSTMIPGQWQGRATMPAQPMAAPLAVAVATSGYVMLPLPTVARPLWQTVTISVFLLIGVTWTMLWMTASAG